MTAGALELLAREKILYIRNLSYKGNILEECRAAEGAT
jgi:hypothetical protein